MRRAAKVDANQEAIVRTLRAHGWSVRSLASMGKGCPDLLVGVQGLNLLQEVKDGAKSPSARRLTEDEIRFFGAWCGHRALVESPEQAVAEVQRHVREMRGPDWTAGEWRMVARALETAARVIGGSEWTAEKTRLALAEQAEAMARALEGTP